jgi:2-polyprenyl-6-methoxyphenol hydroxylase-like FAD-dependent oxidoreductase
MGVRIVIIGAGMAGLMSALALQGADREIIVLDRDPPPPEGGPDAAFDDWERRGVGHFRHSHAFLARLLNLIRDRRPALLEALTAAGARESSFADVMPELLRERYRARPGDERLSILISRRTTLESVLRTYVTGLEGVELLTDAFVNGLELSDAPMGGLSAAGVRGDVEGAPVRWAADLVIDASGRTSQIPDWLAEAGVTIPEEAEDAGILYYTRHYRLRPGRSEPPRGAGSNTGDLGYLKYGVFNADNGWFSITLALPEGETDLRQAIVDPKVFDRICAALPGPAAWIDPIRAEPQTKVFGMGDLKSRWRSFVAEDGRPAALNLFMVGDGLIRSNPLYGRGCTFAAIEAFALADVLRESADPVTRARLYQARLKADLRPFYDNMLKQDRAAIRRAGRARAPERKPNLRSRVMKSLVEDGITLTLRSDVETLRDALSAFHMLAPPDAWLKRPRTLAKVVTTWAAPRAAKIDFYPKPLGPKRVEMLQMLGLAA